MTSKLNKSLSIELLILTLAIISFFFHAIYPIDQKLDLQWTGFALIVISLLFALALASFHARDKLVKFKDFFRANTSWLVFALAFVLLCATQLSALPTWPEEIGWLEIGKAISRGDLVHPIRAKSDFPSSFQAWPIGGLMALGVMPIPASRLISTIFILAYLFILCKFIQEIRKDDKLSWIVGVFAAVSKSYVLVGLTGWHEVTPIFFLVTAQWYYFYRLLRQPSSSEKIIFAIVAGISVWTIYVPVLMTISVGLLMLPWWRRATLPENRRALMVFFLIAAPLFGQAIYTKGALFNRHVGYYLEGGEWADTKARSLFDRIDRFAGVTTIAVERFLPASADKVYVDHDCPHVEWSLIVLALLGLIWSLWKLRQRYALLAPPLFMLFGLLLSTPNQYRLTVLIVPTYIFASLGVLALINFRRRALSLASATLILTIHYFLVWQTLPSIFEKFRNITPEANLAHTVATSISGLKEYPRLILGGGGLTGRLVNGLIRSDSRLVNHSNSALFDHDLARYGDLPILVVFGESNDASANHYLNIALERDYTRVLTAIAPKKTSVWAILLAKRGDLD